MSKAKGEMRKALEVLLEESAEAQAAVVLLAMMIMGQGMEDSDPALGKFHDFANAVMGSQLHHHDAEKIMGMVYVLLEEVSGYK